MNVSGEAENQLGNNFNESEKRAESVTECAQNRSVLKSKTCTVVLPKWKPKEQSTIGPRLRHVTPEICRRFLQEPQLQDRKAEEMIDHLYQFGDVVTQILLGQKSSLQNFKDHSKEPFEELALK